jgi:hypothetical protein
LLRQLLVGFSGTMVSSIGPRRSPETHFAWHRLPCSASPPSRLPSGASPDFWRGHSLKDRELTPANPAANNTRTPAFGPRRGWTLADLVRKGGGMDRAEKAVRLHDDVAEPGRSMVREIRNSKAAWMRNFSTADWKLETGVWPLRKAILPLHGRLGPRRETICDWLPTRKQMTACVLTPEPSTKKKIRELTYPLRVIHF